MGWFKRFSRKKSSTPKKSVDLRVPRNDYYSPATYEYHGPDQTTRLPEKVLRRISRRCAPTRQTTRSTEARTAEMTAA
jgi:hypothetical protein